MSGPLTRERLLGLFERMNEKLAQAGRTGEVYIVGGAVMALAHQATRVTRDVDAWIREGRAAVKTAAKEVAREENLSEHWLNEAVTARHLPESPDRRERPLYKGSNLTIVGASGERMIAMKLDAGREPDREDLNQLLADGQVDTAAEARRLYSMCYGTRQMPPESQAYLIERYSRSIQPPERARRTAPAGQPSGGKEHTRGSGHER